MDNEELLSQVWITLNSTDFNHIFLPFNLDFSPVIGKYIDSSITKTKQHKRHTITINFRENNQKDTHLKIGINDLLYKDRGPAVNKLREAINNVTQTSTSTKTIYQKYPPMLRPSRSKFSSKG